MNKFTSILFIFPFFCFCFIANLVYRRDNLLPNKTPMMEGINPVNIYIVLREKKIKFFILLKLKYFILIQSFKIRPNVQEETFLQSLLVNKCLSTFFGAILIIMFSSFVIDPTGVYISFIHGYSLVFKN